MNDSIYWNFLGVSPVRNATECGGLVSGHSHFPVYAVVRDRVVGVISVKAIYANLAADAGDKLADPMTPPLLVPANAVREGVSLVWRDHRFGIIDMDRQRIDTGSPATTLFRPDAGFRPTRRQR